MLRQIDFRKPGYRIWAQKTLSVGSVTSNDDSKRCNKDFKMIFFSSERWRSIFFKNVATDPPTEPRRFPFYLDLTTVKSVSERFLGVTCGSGAQGLRQGLRTSISKVEHIWVLTSPTTFCLFFEEIAPISWNPMEFCGFVLDPDDIWVSGGSVEGSVISKFLPLKNIDKNLQKSLLSFFKIMPQFCSTNLSRENQLDSWLW